LKGKKTMEQETITDVQVASGKPRFSFKRWQIIALIVFLAAAVRIWSAWQLPVDADEPTYMKAGQEYAQMIKAGDLGGVLRYQFNQEHPALIKLVYSAPFFIFQPEFGSKAELFFNRGISVFFGVLAVLFLCLIDPLAGFLLAMDSMVIKYTSEAYLEALPLFAMMLAVYLMKKVVEGKTTRKWLWVAAMAVGMAVAGKYLYGVVIIPLVGLAIERRYLRWKEALGFVVVAGLSFIFFNPSLWSDPVGNLIRSLGFHFSYTQSQDVLRAGYPWFQPINWISEGVPWHPQVFFYPVMDVVIFALAIPGSVIALRREKWMTAWAVLVLGILLIWTTKWPQYTLILIPALCLLAAEAARFFVNLLKNLQDYWHWADAILFHPGRSFWVVLILFAAAIVVGKVAYEIDLAGKRLGWMQIGMDFSPLPSNTVNDIAMGKNGEVLIATDQGVALWKPSEDYVWGNDPMVFTPENSSLRGADVKAIFVAEDGGWWFAADGGVAVYKGNTWQTFSIQDVNGDSVELLDLAGDTEGRIWVATLQGVMLLENGQWQNFNVGNSGLPNDIVYSVTVQQTGSLEKVWFGTLEGVSSYAPESGTWESNNLAEYAAGFSGVTRVLVDKEDRVWAATLGSGVSVFEGGEWKNYRNSNSQIPQNSVTSLVEVEPGIFWLGFAYPTEPGGVLASFDGEIWNVFSSSNSGYPGYEPSALAVDESGRIWIGMRQGGLVIYDDKNR
jgi:hypothetical protein